MTDHTKEDRKMNGSTQQSQLGEVRPQKGAERLRPSASAQQSQASHRSQTNIFEVLQQLQRIVKQDQWQDKTCKYQTILHITLDSVL